MELLQSELLLRAGAKHMFSTRLGGVSEGRFASLNLAFGIGDALERVEDNMGRIVDKLKIVREDIRTVKQEHRNNIALISRAEERIQTSSRKADAIVTQDKGLAIAVRTADSLPILVHDRRSGAVAAIHVGWRGTIAKLAPYAIRSLCDHFETSPSSLTVAIGPSIRACCYEVGPDLIANFTNNFDTNAWRGKRLASGKETIDLVRCNAEMIYTEGVDKLDILQHCTYCDHQHFFSERRDKEGTGRHLSLIVA